MGRLQEAQRASSRAVYQNHEEVKMRTGPRPAYIPSCYSAQDQRELRPHPLAEDFHSEFYQDFQLDQAKIF